MPGKRKRVKQSEIQPYKYSYVDPYKYLTVMILVQHIRKTTFSNQTILSFLKSRNKK